MWKKLEKLVVTISLLGVIFLQSTRILLIISWSYSLCEARTSFCTGLKTLENFYGLLFTVSTGFISLSVSLLFPYRSPSSSSSTDFDATSFNRDDVPLINPSNELVFRDFEVHHKDR